jgi:hypothetical protein
MTQTLSVVADSYSDNAALIDSADAVTANRP